MNIYISNLNYDITDKELEALFLEQGSVESAKVIIDRYTGKSRGFGFVEMPNEDEAKNAISQLNDSDFRGKTISVNEAKPREDKPRSNFNRGGGGGGNRGGYNSERRY